MQLPRLFNRRRLPMLLLLIANGLGQAGAAVGAALLIQSSFDELLSVPDAMTVEEISWVGGGLLVAALVAGWLRGRERTDSERLGQDYVHAVRMRLHRQLLSVAPRSMQRRSQGTTMLRFAGDLGALRLWVARGIARLMVAGVAISGVLAALFVMAPRIALGLMAVIVLGALIAFQLGGKLEDASRASRRHRGRLSANVSQQVAALSVVQAFGQVEREHERVRRQSRRLRTAMVARAAATGRLMGLGEATGAVATATTLIIGAIEVEAGRISPGTIVASMAIVGLLTAPLRELGRLEAYRQDARVATEKIRAFLETPGILDEQPDAVPLVPGAGRLTFDNVGFGDALVGVTVAAEPGSVVAIVGPNGAGKTTLLALAARLIDPTSGTVALDGQDLGAHTLESVRRAVGLAGPDFPLLRGRIEQNLRYRWPDAPEEEIERVRLLCGIDEVVATLPNGDQTRLTDGGGNLSAGQRQRIALARAILGGPAVLLLDEADANLDPGATETVDRVVSGFAGTVLLVTHRRDRLDGADAIWHLRDGCLIEAGPAGEVLGGDGPTARLFQRLPATAASIPAD